MDKKIELTESQKRYIVETYFEDYDEDGEMARLLNEEIDNDDYCSWYLEENTDIDSDDLPYVVVSYSTFPCDEDEVVLLTEDQADDMLNH